MRALKIGGPALCLSAMTILQFGMALSLPIVSRVGPVHASFLRFTVASAIAGLLVAALRPTSIVASFSRASVVLGVCMAGMGIFFAMALTRMPLALAMAIEFTGPMTVAILAGGRIKHVVVALFALAGVVLVLSVHAVSLSFYVVSPAFGAAACWGGYIVASRRVGKATSGLIGLVGPLFVAAGVSWLASRFERPVESLDASSYLPMIAVAVAYPLIPYALELMALRRMTSHRFGILTSGEPVVAMVVGFFVLGQTVVPWQVLGIVVIVCANLASIEGA